MKSFTLSAIAIAFALFMSGTGSAAQSFFDGTFVRVGAGANMMYDNHKVSAGGIALDLSAGKWVTDQIALRVGYHGITDKAADPNGWLYGSDSFGYHCLHADVLWDLVSTFNNDNRRDSFSVGPMAQCGGIVTHKESRAYAITIGGGAFVEYRFNDRFSVSCELSAMMADEKVWRPTGRLTFFPSATVGVGIWL
ncbi:MAG: hypothetical protein IK143_04525 [Bacteroidales bacterium]|nr:hypothetical protein [Bacteroidales bacterium]